MLYVHKSFVEGLFAGCKVISIVITLTKVMGPSHIIQEMCMAHVHVYEHQGLESHGVCLIHFTEKLEVLLR